MDPDVFIPMVGLEDYYAINGNLQIKSLERRCYYNGHGKGGTRRVPEGILWWSLKNQWRAITITDYNNNRKRKSLGEPQVKELYTKSLEQWQQNQSPTSSSETN